MFPQMSGSSISVDHVAGLNSGRAASHILLVGSHRRLAHAAHGWRISGVALRVRRRIALIGGASLTLYDGAGHHAMHGARILAPLDAGAHRGAALHVFCERLRVFVVGMTATEGGGGFGLLVSGVVDSHPVDGPQPLFDFGRLNRA